jgi:SAM-dependent methyltransferase
MTWDSIWEDIFATQDWGKYPPEELIRFTARNFYKAPDKNAVKFLELGCGTGANMWYLAREGFSAYGIDGSKSAIEKAQKRLMSEGLQADLRVGDVGNISAVYTGTQFDAIIDVGCLQCNPLNAVQNIVNQTYALLKPGGMFFGIMAATESYGYGIGDEVEPGTFTNIQDGPLKGRGLNHFFTLEEIQTVWANFQPLSIEYSLFSLNERQDAYKYWVVRGAKPA